MGSWGPGPFENDHAMDLLSLETARWRDELQVLDDPETCWDDIEGLLGYVALLAYAAKETGMHGLLIDKTKASSQPQSSRDVATRWKARFLEIEAQVSEEPGFVKSASFTARRKAVTKTFDALIRAAADDDAPPPKPKKKAGLRKRVA